MNEIRLDKPTPLLDRDSKPFWDSLQERNMRLQRCAECGKIRHYPRPVCVDCYSMEVDWVLASGKGKIHSWTVSYHAFHPGFIPDLPLTLVTVDLEEGVRMCAQMRDFKPDELRLDLPVILGYEALSDDITLPVFHPA